MNFIWIKTQFEGIHCYPNAPKEVDFLRVRHRHIFHVKVMIEIFHDNRDIEFILFKRYVDTLISDNNFDSMSCEMISDRFYDIISKKYPNRKMVIEVSEDNENGSLKSYENIPS